MAAKKPAFNKFDVFKTFGGDDTSYPHRFFDTDGNQVVVPFRLWEIGREIFVTMSRFCQKQAEDLEALHLLAFEADSWMECWFDIFVDENEFPDWEEDEIEICNFCELDIVESGIGAYPEIDHKEEMLPALCYLGFRQIEGVVRSMVDGSSPDKLIEQAVEADRFAKIIAKMRWEIYIHRLKAERNAQEAENVAGQVKA